MTPGHKKTISIPLAAAVVAAAAGCFTLQPVGENPNGQPMGSVEAGSPALGTATFQPGSCLAGEREMFLGADFIDSAQGMILRLVWDPLAGPAVRVFDRSDPSEKSIVFRKADCGRFDASLEGTNWRINDVDDYKVKADVECGDPQHGYIKAHLSAAHCH